MPFDNQGAEEPFGDDTEGDYRRLLGSTTVGTTSPGPEALSETPLPQAPLAVTDVGRPSQDDGVDTPPEQLPEFPPDHRKDFEGLLFLGKLTREFTYLGHRFVVKTLTVDELLEVGLIHRRYLETTANAQAYSAAIVAACLVTVDGRQLPMPVTHLPEDTLLVNRFDWVRGNLFPPVVDAVFEQYVLLEATVEKVMVAMGEARG